jgi:uncharacterized tellurite resistance protein B-like protein
MMEFIRSIFGTKESYEKKLIDYMESLEKETPNNYQFGSLMRQKIREHRENRMEFKKNNSFFSH